MPRNPTGQLYVNRLKGGHVSFGVRFRHGGKRHYVNLGRSDEGLTRRDAERAVEDLMAKVRLGFWQPEEDRPPEPAAPAEVPTFHEFASEWYENLCLEGGARGRGLSEKGREDLLWRLSSHLLPFFAGFRLDRIRVEDVDRYRRAKVTEGRLGPTSINKTLTTLAAVLEVAVEYGHVERNPAKGRRRRLRAATPRRTYLDRAEHVAALLDGAAELDAAGRVVPYRRVLLAVLVFGGLRIGEALDLRWGDVDLAAGRLAVRGTKTDAADRLVELLPVLRDELLAFAAAARVRRADARVFGTSSGAKRSPSNVRNRLLAPAVERADRALAERGAPPLPEGLTPHSLRRTFASLLVALGRDPAVVMRQMGHTTPHMTLGVYAAAMDWSGGERDRLRALVEGCTWAEEGNMGVPSGLSAKAPAALEEPDLAR